ncbi:MAG: protein kinase [Burkholderiales bacterium]|nr:protein kinase [Burkholderiales bacterium]
MHKLGRYEILGELGRGAMGVVYEARDPVIDRVLAIKTVDPQLSGEALESFRERFFREARSAGRLNHPCIVTIYDAGEADGVSFIAMELLRGPTLREALAGRALPVARAVDVAMQVAYGLAFAHEHGIVHRDVKPANIVLVGKRRVKIADFGIARLSAGGAGTARDVAGSPKYMSPEQIGGGEIDGRSDVFALGAVLYEMLAGRPPFRGDSVNAVMYAVLETDPPPPSTLNRRVPADLDAIVMRMLAKRREDRYESARALYRDLRRWQKAHGERAGSRPSRERREEAPAASPQAGDDTIVLGAPNGGALPAWRRAAIGAGAVAVLVAAMGAWWIAGRESAGRAAPEVVAAQGASLPQPAPDAVPAAPMPATAALPPAAPEPQAAAKAAPKPAPRPAPKPVAPPPVAAPAPAPVAVAEPPRETARPAPLPAPAKATIQLAIAPWGQVFVDGKFHGTTPPMTALELPPGEHRVTIVHDTLPAYNVAVKVDAGETRRIAHRFD